ncbi:nicotinamide N-methyltransferase-like [Ascaphus truei]|uniref:nicotinamide N-methyltransferase-like n=1 Tax=Ascaphus truei TaxID=8439 RepID=UPI003F59158B
MHMKFGRHRVRAEEQKINPMDSSHKQYHHVDIDPRIILDTYICAENNDLQEEILEYPLKQLYKAFTSGGVSGDTLIDITMGPVILHLLSASEIFKEIIVLDPVETHHKELEMWLKKYPGSFDWSHLSKYVCDMEGKGEDWQEKEDKTRRAVTRVLKCDLTKANPSEPVVLPQVDCLLSCGCLEVFSKHQDEYRSILKNMSSLLKVGGYLLLYGLLNMSYYKLGEHTLHVLTYDEEFLRQALSDTGYIIQSLVVFSSKKKSDLLDYDHLVFVVARKEREI